MKRDRNHVASRRKRNSGIDEGQIIESLRLTPTERWEKHRAFIDLVEELERATGLRPRHPQPPAK